MVNNLIKNNIFGLTEQSLRQSQNTFAHEVCKYIST